MTLPRAFREVWLTRRRAQLAPRITWLLVVVGCIEFWVGLTVWIVRACR